jgi:hypothetical protein
MLALLAPLLKSQIQRLQNKYKLELEGLGECFFSKRCKSAVY